MLHSAGEFVLDRKSKRIGIKSALMEYAVLQRGLQVTRHNRVVIVAEADGIQLGFSQMNGMLSRACLTNVWSRQRCRGVTQLLGMWWRVCRSGWRCLAIASGGRSLVRRCCGACSSRR